MFGAIAMHRRIFKAHSSIIDPARIEPSILVGQLKINPLTVGFREKTVRCVWSQVIEPKEDNDLVRPGESE
jgi:hypothetical protein